MSINKSIDGSFKSPKIRCKEFIDKYLNLDKIKESQLEQLSYNFSLDKIEVIDIVNKLLNKTSKRKYTFNHVRTIK